MCPKERTCSASAVSSGQLPGEHLLRGSGTGETQDRVEGHPELPGDGPLAVTGGEESVDGGVLGAGAFGEPVPCRPGRRSWLRLFLRFLRLGRRGTQAATVPVDALLGGFAQVVPEGTGGPSARCLLSRPFSHGPQPERRVRLSPHVALR